ncbi:tyrosine-type recombinase/integrase [Actinoplanes sp. NPDC089786]|uniref:tyrosine-type recombinase/integrase n=1 Tax=Actinoplanes sp. NPDC089786 TaxID=3155185 RepID=UPI00342B2D48
MPASDVQLLLDRCPRDNAVEVRDYAILMLVARLGLRSIEVARLRLDDVDWRGGEIAVRSKGRREDRLPPRRLAGLCRPLLSRRAPRSLAGVPPCPRVRFQHWRVPARPTSWLARDLDQIGLHTGLTRRAAGRPAQIWSRRVHRPAPAAERPRLQSPRAVDRAPRRVRQGRRRTAPGRPHP